MCVYSIIYSCHPSHVNCLIFELPTFVAASVIEFDDNEKQRMYKMISFKEVHDEIVELKVVLVFIDLFIFACDCSVLIYSILF